MRRRSLLVVLLASGAISAFYVGCVRPVVVGLRQVKTTANIHIVCAYLEEYRREHHTYPAELSTALPPTLSSDDRAAFLTDAWGYPLHYQAREAAFILVSYGADHMPDGPDYWAIRSSFGNAAYKLEACHDPRSDIIASDIAFQRPCGK
jgi:hypothetical protein